MLRSVWFANLDIMVNNIRYLQDDEYEYQQPSEPYKSDQSDKSELGVINHIKYYDDIGYRASTGHECTCTGDCDNYDRAVSKLDNDLINIKLNDSINDNNELYTKLK